MKGEGSEDCGKAAPQKVKFLFDPAIPLLGRRPKRLNTGVQTKTHTHTLVAALFTLAKRWRQPPWPPTGVRMDKSKEVYPHNGLLFGHEKG